MNGNRVLLDTNIILFSYKSISLNEEKEIQKFLSKFRIISIDQSVKELSIQLRKRYSLKIPDTIIAATSISLGIPLVTADKGFEQISELTIDLYNK